MADFRRLPFEMENAPVLWGSFPENTVLPVPAVLVLPGGGYTHLASHEGIPVAREFVSAGMAAFVLEYGVLPEAVFPVPLMQAFAAVRWVRAHASEWGIDPGRVFVCGFSAGGHLAAAMGTGWEHPLVKAAGFTGCGHRPDGMILAYAAARIGDLIPEEECGQLESLYQSEWKQFLFTDTLVSAQTPPAFLWHTCEDTVVPVSQCLAFAGALSANGVPFELRVYPDGPHGLGLARNEDGRSAWPCAEWMESAKSWIQHSKSTCHLI